MKLMESEVDLPKQRFSSRSIDSVMSPQPQQGDNNIAIMP
jgi:hypothetical protein